MEFSRVRFRSPEPAFSVLEADIAGIQQAMHDGTLTSHELVQAYLDRIAAIDDAGPGLNAVIELNPDTLSEADQRDAERRQGRVRGPLHGVAVLLKDNIDATPMINSAGSLALADNRPSDDAFVVRSEEHTSELQSLMRISYAVFCLKKKKKINT